ncbi:MAG: DUF92 domain-containing protein [Anaerolineae bacterium]|jgi:uncharacterized protein (TIGR00297 family)|nr:DUF92 domain-containing protein [Anaerolineae bacterium]MBT7070778.1 DUF92 domain-containing protein [Anaerolineae bacterium]MBT7325022.1 DUF92 domain-containing protein [Anaerolineae bacterium]
MPQLFLGSIFAIIISLLAYKAKSLDKSGAIAATVEGILIFGLGGWEWAILLLAFFISSSALSKMFKARKKGLKEKFDKGSRRDAMQVLGNGGLAAIFATLNYFFPDTHWTWLGFAAALAAVNADTWATELGVLNPTRPRMITNLKQKVEKGTSGGVSVMGTFASLAGSVLIGILAGIFSPNGNILPIFTLITLAGLLGALFDSYLGATVQAIYHCPSCEKETERHPIHLCGTETRFKRGFKWLTNDWVNFACATTGVLIALVF